MKLKVITEKYPIDPKEIVTGIGIEDEKIEGYHKILFNTILPDTDGEYIKEHEEIKEWAERIVRCCNNFDEVKANLKDAVFYLQGYIVANGISPTLKTKLEEYKKALEL